MALTDLMHHGTMDEPIDNNFEGCTQSGILVDKFAEEVCKHPNLTRRVQKITNSNETETHLVAYGIIVELRAQPDLPSTAYGDDSQ